MSLTIGRLREEGYGTGEYGSGAYGASNGLPQLIPLLWNVDGEIITLQGGFVGENVAHGLALRSMLLGYVGNLDEALVPILADEDPSIDGFYRVLQMAVQMVGPSLAHGAFEFSAQLERVRGYAAPLFESVLSGATMANDHALSGAAWHGLPAAHRGYTLDIGNYLRVSSTGDVRAYVGLADYAARPSYWVPPENWYDGAASVYLLDEPVGASDPTEAVLARQVVVGRDIENRPTAWCLENGLIRVFPRSTDGALCFQFFDGLRWEGETIGDDSKDLSLLATIGADQAELGGTNWPWSTVTVLRNSPEVAAVRITADLNPAVSSPRVTATVDLTLRRGSRFVAGFVSLSKSSTLKLQTSKAVTAITGGIRETSDDGAGNRLVLAMSKAHTVVGADGAIQKAGVTSLDFMFGAEINGSAATTAEDAASLVTQYLAGQGERMLVSQR